MNNDVKVCECGCGLPAPIATGTDRRLGWYKGQPKRFILGHVMRVRNLNGVNNPAWKGGHPGISQGYVFLFSPGHPRAHNNRVQEHILVAERAIRRTLPQGAQVHHVNEVRSDNRGSNLVICEDMAYHKLLHKRTRAVKAGFPANWLRCWRCKAYDATENLILYQRKHDTSTTNFHSKKSIRCSANKDV